MTPEHKRIAYALAIARNRQVNAPFEDARLDAIECAIRCVMNAIRIERNFDHNEFTAASHAAIPR